MFPFLFWSCQRYLFQQTFVRAIHSNSGTNLCTNPHRGFHSYPSALQPSFFHKQKDMYYEIINKSHFST